MDDDPGPGADILQLLADGGYLDDAVRRFLPLHSIDGPDDTDARVGIVGRLLARRETSLLIAPPFVGKSALAAHLAWHAATGRPWFGQVVPYPVPVLIVAAERFPEMKRRLRALAAEYPAEGAAKVMVAHARGLDLRKRDTASLLRATVQEFAILCGSFPGLIILDTLAKLTPGADEISGADMTAAMSTIEGMRDECGCHMVVIHHTPRDNPRQSRGHSSIDGAVDVILCLERRDGHLRWSVTAANSIGAPFPSGEFELASVDVASGSVPIVRQITKAVGTRDAAVLAAVKAARGPIVVSELVKLIEDASFADLEGEARRKAVDRSLASLSEAGLAILDGKGRSRSARSAEAA